MIRLIAMGCLGLYCACGDNAATTPDASMPSCEDAIGHYYSIGCTFSVPLDPPATPQPIDQYVFTNTCRFVQTSTNARCQPMIDAIIQCAAAATPGACSCQALYSAIGC